MSVKLCTHLHILRQPMKLQILICFFLTNKNVKHKIEDDFFKSEAAACLLSLATNTKISKSSHRPAAVGVTVIVIVSGNIFFVLIEVV